MNRSRDDVTKSDQRKQVIFWSILAAVLLVVLFGCTVESNSAGVLPGCSRDLNGNITCTGVS